MKSPQEVLYIELSAKSVGADFVFQPPHYAKGNATREPADLVWACNNCLILMYMRQKKKRITSEGHSQMRQALIRHNLNQAKGWLKEWKGGRFLEGRNGTQNFSIKYGKYKHVFVLSVLDCGDDEAVYHEGATAKLGVTACLTISQQALLEIARIGGSIIEVLTLLKNIVVLSKSGIQVKNAAAIVNQNQQAALTYADSQSQGLSPGVDLVTNRIQTLLLLLRAPNPGMVSMDKSDEPYWLGALLNDMTLGDLYLLTRYLRIAIEHAGPEHTYNSSLIFRALSGYYVALTATNLFSSNFIEITTETNAKMPGLIANDTSSKGGLIILWDTMGNAPISLANMPPEPDRIVRTFAEEFADTILELTKQ